MAGHVDLQRTNFCVNVRSDGPEKHAPFWIFVTVVLAGKARTAQARKMDMCATTASTKMDANAILVSRVERALTMMTVTCVSVQKDGLELTAMPLTFVSAAHATIVANVLTGKLHLPANVTENGQASGVNTGISVLLPLA